MTEELSKNLELVIAVSIFGFGALMCLGLIIVAFTLARRLKDEFSRDDSFIPMYWPLWVSSVAVCCTYRWPAKSKHMYPHFRGFDVNGFANRFERFASYLMTYSFFLLIFAVLFSDFSDAFLGTNIHSE